MQRRQLLGAGLALAGASALPAVAAAAPAAPASAPARRAGRRDADWAAAEQRGGRPPRAACRSPTWPAPTPVKLLANPFYVADTPALTESSGWLDAWRSSPSA